jgi:hypothetical protein
MLVNASRFRLRSNIPFSPANDTLPSLIVSLLDHCALLAPHNRPTSTAEFTQ